MLKMKIGLVLSNTPARSETFFISKIKGLKDRGYEMIIFANKNNDFNVCEVVPHPVSESNSINLAFKLIISFIKLILFRPFTLLRFLYLERKDDVSFIRSLKNLYLNSHILSMKLDWLHFGFMTLTINRQNVAAAIKSRMGVSLRGYDICIYPLTHQKCYDNVWGKIDKVHSISNDLLKVAKEDGLSAKKPCHIITPAINLTYFNNNPRIWKKPKTIKFLTLSRLHWKKGLEHTLSALSMLYKEGTQFRYKIVGEGPERERLIYAAHQLGIDKIVEFVGSVSHEETKRYYENADIYLQYSIQEGYSNSALEAQAMGLITIVSDAEGLPENIKNKNWIVQKNNPVALAKKIKSICEDKEEKINRMIINALHTVEKENNVENQIKEFLGFYEQ